MAPLRSPINPMFILWRTSTIISPWLWLIEVMWLLCRLPDSFSLVICCQVTHPINTHEALHGLHSHQIWNVIYSSNNQRPVCHMILQSVVFKLALMYFREKTSTRIEHLPSAMGDKAAFCDSCSKRGIAKMSATVHCAQCKMKFCAKHQQVRIVLQHFESFHRSFPWLNPPWEALRHDDRRWTFV